MSNAEGEALLRNSSIDIHYSRHLKGSEKWVLHIFFFFITMSKKRIKGFLKGGIMRKLLTVFAFLGLLVYINSCGGGGDNPKAVMNDYFNVMDGFIAGMEKAETADDVVAAINKLSDGMKDLAPRMKALQENYPELKNMGNQGKLPEEFKEFEEKIKEMGPKMMGLTAKMMKFASDPKVMEAQKKMTEAMTSVFK
jgi:hypothetical protein